MATNDALPRTNVDLISTGTTVSKDFPSEYLKLVTLFYSVTGVFHTIKPEHNIKDSFFNLIGGVLKVITIEQGKISCLLAIKPPTLTEVIVDGSVVRSGRNLTVVVVEFRHKELGLLAFMARATFYNMPIARL